ncbi:MAG: hypothetical protein JWN48_1460 [Myxococcaceae bacterium]|nr:hypothetical protein [Myxococcaceae bacterium]
MRHSLMLLALLAACTRSSDPRLYTLVEAKSAASYPSARTIEVRRPSMAGYLDRREIVRGVLQERLDVASDANWAEPLDAMFGRVLAADLSLRLPRSRVFTDLNTLGAVSDVRIDIELQRFDQSADGLVLRALVALRNGAQMAPVNIEAIELRQPGKQRAVDGQVAAMNALLGQLADRIAHEVSQLAPPGP